MPDELDEFFDLVGGEPAGSGRFWICRREFPHPRYPYRCELVLTSDPGSRTPGNCDYCGTGSVARCNCGRNPLTCSGLDCPRLKGDV
jgi:hypothetical protein